MSYYYRRTIGRYETGNNSYHVILSKPGPRGGKRPPLLDVDVYAENQEQAISRAKAYLARRLHAEVTF